MAQEHKLVKTHLDTIVNVDLFLSLAAGWGGETGRCRFWLRATESSWSWASPSVVSGSVGSEDVRANGGRANGDDENGGV